MQTCGHCGQRLGAFAFFCPRCAGPVGRLALSGVMIEVVWLDAQGGRAARHQLKTLKLGDTYLDAASVSPPAPVKGARHFVITTTDGRRIRQGLVEAYEQAAGPTQEWLVSESHLVPAPTGSLPLFPEDGAI